MMPSSIKKICSFFKKSKCARKLFIFFVMLSNVNKTSNHAVTHFSYKMHEIDVFYCKSNMGARQCDSAFCALQLTALIKPN